MKITDFNKGIITSSLGSFWWGFIGTYYFHYITFIGTIEVVVHRCVWTTLMLLITTTFYNKWYLFKKYIFNKKTLLILLITSILIFANWSIWIYAVATNRIIDASFGYFIFPIISVFFGFLFFNEKLNKKRFFSISLVIISTIYLFFNLNSLPWVGFALAFIWSTYNLLRKKINVNTDIGLFIESLFIFPIAIIVFYFIFQNNMNDFSLSNPSLMPLLILAGPMTVIPLFLYVKGVELSGLGPSGLIFFIAPTGQFLLGFFYYNEAFSIHKFISFIIIWIAVSIYLKDLYENN
jgi:chloramphenicol-sensitive protein RarD